MTKMVKTIIASSLFLFSLGITSHAMETTTQKVQTQVKLPKSLADKKTEAEIKKAKADRLKTIVDIASNKMVLTCIGVALLIGGRYSKQIGEYLGRAYGSVAANNEAHKEAVKAFLTRCYKAVLSLPLNISHSEAMNMCHNPHLTLAEVANLEDAAQKINLMSPANTYWSLSLADKAKHFAHKIFGSATDGASKVAGEATVSWLNWLKLVPKKS